MMKRFLKEFLFLLIGLVLIVFFEIAQVNSMKTIARKEIVNAQVTNNADLVMIYQSAITYRQEDLKIQLIGLKTLLEMGEKMPELYIYETWENELNKRLTSIALDFENIVKCVPPDSEKARHDQLTSDESEFYQAEKLILGGININDQGMINLGRAILEGIAY